LIAIGTLLFSYAVGPGPGEVVGANRVIAELALSPIILEFVYRAGLQRIVARNSGMIGGILAAGVCYALYHDYLREFWEFLAFSVLVGVAYSLSGSLLLAVIAHSVTNIGEMFRQQFKDALYGFYPGFGLLEAVVVLVAATVVIARVSPLVSPPRRHEIEDHRRSR
jgi:membrane protease YdiL (CAAX protease family)